MRNLSNVIIVKELSFIETALVCISVHTPGRDHTNVIFVRKHLHKNQTILDPCGGYIQGKSLTNVKYARNLLVYLTA